MPQSLVRSSVGHPARLAQASKSLVSFPGARGQPQKGGAEFGGRGRPAWRVPPFARRRNRGRDGGCVPARARGRNRSGRVGAESWPSGCSPCRQGCTNPTGSQVSVPAGRRHPRSSAGPRGRYAGPAMACRPSDTSASDDQLRRRHSHDAAQVGHATAEPVPVLRRRAATGSLGLHSHNHLTGSRPTAEAVHVLRMPGRRTDDPDGPAFFVDHVTLAARRPGHHV